MSLLTGNTMAMICGGLIALAFGGLGVVLIVLYLRNKQKAKASESWPSTQGRIVSTNVRVDEVGGDDGKIRYAPEVHFEYQVDGVMYPGKRISFGSEPDFVTRQKANQFLEQYPVDQIVQVFYNPEKPQEAVLMQKMRSMTAGLVVGIVLLVLMVCFLCPIGIGLFNMFFKG